MTSDRRVRVDIFDAFTGAIASVFRNFGGFFRAALPPALVFSGVLVAFYLHFFQVAAGSFTEAAHPPRPEDLLRPLLVPMLLMGILLALALVAFVVRWFQVQLDPAPPGWLDPRTLRAFGRFLLYQLGAQASLMLMLAVVFALVALLLALTPDRPERLLPLIPLALVLYIGVSLTALRCALLFPAAALGRPLSLGEAWRLMRGNAWRLGVALLVTAIASELALIVVVLVVELVLLLLGLIVIAVLLALHVNPTSSPALLGVGLVLGTLVLCLLMTAVEFVLTAVFTSVVAIFYRKIVLEAAPGPAPPLT